MGFTLDLYKNTDDPKVVFKNPGIVQRSVTCNPYKAVSLTNPQLEIDYNANAMGCNYCYVGAFERYYFINDIVITPAQKMILSCSIDVLYTYRNQLGNLDACITRSESIGAPTYVVDDRLPINPVVKDFKSAVFTGGFTPSFNNTDKTLLIRMATTTQDPENN
jgi:hypothetical protein